MSEKMREINYLEDTSYFWGSPPESQPSWGEVDDSEPSMPPQAQCPLTPEGPYYVADPPMPGKLSAE